MVTPEALQREAALEQLIESKVAGRDGLHWMNGENNNYYTSRHLILLLCVTLGLCEAMYSVEHLDST